AHRPARPRRARREERRLPRPVQPVVPADGADADARHLRGADHRPHRAPVRPRPPRPFNENTNRWLREYFPKGTTITKPGLSQAGADELNNRPRAIFGFKKPKEVFAELLTS